MPIAFFLYLSLNKISDEKNAFLFPDIKTAIQQSKQLIQSKTIWLNGIWAGLFYVPTVVLTAQYGLMYFQSLYGLNNYESLQAITFLLMGWVIFSPLYTSFSSRYGWTVWLIAVAALALIISLFIMTYLPQLVGAHILTLAFSFGVFSTAQVLVWQLFHRICPTKVSGVGIALTNMIITGVTELGQLASGALLDWHQGFIAFRHWFNVSQPIQLDALLFFVFIITSMLVLKKLSKLINKRQA